MAASATQRGLPEEGAALHLLIVPACSALGTAERSLTSRHQILPQHWHPEVTGQCGQVGPYAREFLAHFGGLCAEVAESTQAHDAMGVVPEDIVPGGQQVVRLHQLQGKTSGQRILTQKGAGMCRRGGGRVVDPSSSWDALF